jgi:oligosaccharide repeat unit polymerase
VTELTVSIGVALIIFLIYRRYRNIFSLPFFWAAVFACMFVGLLELHAEIGGSAYLYGAYGFGAYYFGLLAADFLFLLYDGKARAKDRHQHPKGNTPEAESKPDKTTEPTKLKLLFPSLPMNIGLFVSLIGASFITFVLFSNQGLPIFSSFPAMAWVQSTSGVVNRMMTVFGPGCYASLGLIAWAINREIGSRTAKGLMFVGLGLAILAQSLLATKAAAIMIFIWFNIMLFYLNKKRDFRKSILPFLIIVVPVSAAIVMVRLMSSYGYWQSGAVAQTFVSRVTTEAAEPLDYIVKYSDRWGPMHGGAMRLELQRIKEQLTGQTKTPILSEYVFDLMSNQPTNDTGLSSALTLAGTGYIEWGLAGLLLYSFLQGLVFGWIHRYLLRKETMNIVMLLFWGGILNYVMAASVSGTILVGLEGALLAALPPLILLIPFCLFFLLPVARRYRFRVDRRITRAHQA